MEADDAVCFCCGRSPCDFHHALPNAGKKASEDIGAWVWLCRECHAWAHDTAEGVAWQKELKAMIQEAYEEDHSRAEWFAIAHKNYRKD